MTTPSDTGLQEPLLPPKPKIRVMLADDHDLVLEGLSIRLKDIKELEVIGTANDGKSLLPLLDSEKPDVLVLDINMPSPDGFEVLQHIRDHNLSVRVLVLTALVDGLSLQRALELGAQGIALKTDPPRQTVEAIRQVGEGKLVYPQAVQNWLLRRATRTTAPVDAQALTTREDEVLALVAEGLTNQEIAFRLTVSENTVKYHVQNIYGKLGVTNRTEAARHYLERGKHP